MSTTASEQSPSSSQPGEVWAVLVVHGVGETGPGITVDTFLPALAAVNHNIRPTGDTDVLWLGEASFPPSKFVDTFPVHVRHADVPAPKPGEPAKAIFAEVYWADIAKVGQTFFELLSGLISTIFLLRSVTEQTVAFPGRVARFLRFVLYLCGITVVGPVAALTTLLALFLAVGFSLDVLLTSTNLAHAWLNQVLCLVALAGGTFAAVTAWRSSWCVSWKVFVTSFALAAVGAQVAAQLSSLTSTAQVLFLALVFSYGVLGVMTTLAFLIYAVAWCCYREHRPGLSAGLALMVLQIGAWVLLGPLVVLVILKGFPHAAAREIQAFLMPVLYAFVSHLIFLSLLMIGVICVVIARFLWISTYIQTPGIFKESSGKPPHNIFRLIVNPFLVFLMILLFGIAYLGYWIVFLRHFDDSQNTQDTQRHTLVVFLGFFISGAIIVFPMIFALAQQSLRDSLHITLDVINHFYRGREAIPWPWQKTKPTENVVDEFVIQRRIEARFKHVLYHVLQNPDVTHLTVVAHSQGTIIAVDCLNDKNIRALLKEGNRQIKTRLVTMGSPLTHLYQHYFPFRYPELPYPALAAIPIGKDSHTPAQSAAVLGWRGLPHTVDGWLNVYRLDDYVGTYVTCVDDDNNHWLVNHPVGPGGHTGYWHERNVVERISRELPGR